MAGDQSDRCQGKHKTLVCAWFPPGAPGMRLVVSFNSSTAHVMFTFLTEDICRRWRQTSSVSNLNNSPEPVTSTERPSQGAERSSKPQAAAREDQNKKGKTCTKWGGGVEVERQYWFLPDRPTPRKPKTTDSCGEGAVECDTRRSLNKWDYSSSLLFLRFRGS